jgi:hypothetical protein
LDPPPFTGTTSRERICPCDADRLLPLATEFALFLPETPEDARTGPVFRLEGCQERHRDSGVSKIVSKIGKAAGVVRSNLPKCLPELNTRIVNEVGPV